MNRVELIGRLTRDPELRYTNDQKAVCKFTLAVNRNGKDAGADFIRIQVWDKSAENCEKYLSKGSMVGVEGRITTSQYEKEGKKQTMTEVRADRVEFIQTEKREAKDDPASDNFQEIQEEIPF